MILFDGKPGTSQAALMKTTIDLPAELVTEIRLRAARAGHKLKDAFAELLRRGLAASAHVPLSGGADRAALKRRKHLMRKFVTGEWGVDLDGAEAGREADRRTAKARADAWSD